MKLKKSSGLLYRNMIVNILLFMIPFLLLFCMWVNTQYSEEIQNYLEGETHVLNQGSGQIETILNDLERTAYQISFDRSINFYQWSQGTYDSVLSTQQLRYYRSGSNDFQDLAVCFEGSTKLFLTGGMTDITAFSTRAYVLRGDLTMEELHSLMNSRKVYGFLSSSKYLKQNSYRYTIITYPIISVEQQKYATLSGILDYDYLKACFPEQESFSQTIICNNAGELLYSSAEEVRDVPGELLELAQKGMELTEYEEDGSSWHVILMFSEATQLYYIRMIRAENLLNQLIAKILPGALLVMLIGILVVSIFAAVLSFYSYVPIRNLLRMFDKDIDYREKHNELLMLNDYIRELQNKNKSLKQIINEKEREQIRSVLVDVLFGRYSLEEEDILLLQKHDISFDDAEFTIVMLQCEVNDSLENQILTDRLRDFSEKHLFWITQEPSNYFVFLYHAPRGTRGAIQQAKVLHGKLQEDGYVGNIGIGSYTDTISQLHISLMEGILCLYHEKDGFIHEYDSGGEYAEETYSMNVLPGKEELLLLLAIQKGDREQILSIVKRMETEVGKLIHYYQSKEIRYKLYRISGYLRELPGITEESLKEYVKRLIYYKDIADFFANFKECINRVSVDERLVYEVKGITIQTIQDFVDENLCSQEMSLTYVAEHFKIRSSYLSTFFKESTGINFVTYIQEKRMEYAKKMLCETKLSIQQVVVAVGYSDVPSFSKKFSAKYGMPPGAYRKMMQCAKFDIGKEGKNICEMPERGSGKQG